MIIKTVIKLKNNLKVFIPILMAISVIIGFTLGIGLTPNNTNNSFIQLKSNNFNMLNEIVNYIDNEYVDTVQKQMLIDKTVSYLLQELDPHSYYISAEDLSAMNEPLEGNFEGIGIQFNIRKDTVMVVTPLSGGPSEKVGIKAGDRIIKVDDENIAGIDIKNADVLAKLKGNKGTKVKVTVLRNNKDIKEFEIIRDKIPIYSIDVSYMVNQETGYIKVSRFAKTTYEEFVNAGDKLIQDGMKTLVIDLRGNGGGFLDAAVKMADEFLPNNETIVFTEGKSRPKKYYKSTNRQLFKGIKTVILIDGASASASEILAGAIQDNDRGVIIGRRSFGKGLVQEQASWPDGSATRLTTARYYTPSGRSIQKPYDKGIEAYNAEYATRFENGELVNADSINFPDSLKYTTKNGRVIYGGGGIMPDYFVPIDTSYHAPILNQLTYRGLIYEFAFEYSDKNRARIKNEYKSAIEFANSFEVTPEMLEEIVKTAAKSGVETNQTELRTIKKHIDRRVTSYIARNLWNNEGFYPIWNKGDKLFNKALDITKKGEL